MTAQTVTVTLTGGPHLAEFASFSLKAVRAFDPLLNGPRCLRGSYLRADGARTPPMNTPSTYPLPPDAPVYVYGKAAPGASHDLHLPLTHAPGERVVVPLTVATARARADLTRLADLLADAPFVFAKTMARNPHFYTTRKSWPRDEDFAFAVATIRRYGYRQKYGGAWYTVLGVGNFYFWTMGWPLNWTNGTPCTILINRKELTSPVFPADAVQDQTLIIDDARRLDIPPLRDGWQGLSREFTACPFFRWGVATFGYRLQRVLDLRPRLVTRRRA